jgi:quaternary ammonium compound-resistance protein SugE
MAWFYLFLAGLFEMGWPVGLKIAQADGSKVKGVVFAVTCMIMSVYFLYWAQKNIPIGTAYAVWTAIGASGTFLVGVYFYGDHAHILHYLGITMIIGGVIVLKMAS